MIYENCKVYGVYKNQENREFVIIIFPSGKKKTTSYARYLMEMHLGRYLTNEEDVHHKDENFFNNNIENLEIVVHKEHTKNHSIKYSFDLNVICSECGKKFVIPSKKISEKLGNKRRQHYGNFCSRKCVGIYGKKIQMGIVNKLNASDDELLSIYK